MDEYLTPYAYFISYFSQLAEEHCEIAMCYELDEEEILSGLRSKIKYPCLMLEVPDFGLYDNKVNTDSVVPSGITILSPVKPGNPDKRKELLISHERIMLDIVSRLREDDRRARWHVDTNQLRYNKVGPVFSDHCYGWRLEVRYQRWVDLTVKAERWTLE